VSAGIKKPLAEGLDINESGFDDGEHLLDPLILVSSFFG
jgi:hypothetical protein